MCVTTFEDMDIFGVVWERQIMRVIGDGVATVASSAHHGHTVRDRLPISALDSVRGKVCGGS